MKQNKKDPYPELPKLIEAANNFGKYNPLITSKKARKIPEIPKVRRIKI